MPNHDKWFTGSRRSRLRLVYNVVVLPIEAVAWAWPLSLEALLEAFF